MFLGKPQKRVHTTLDFEDYAYAKKHNLKLAHLIRAAIRDHRVNIDDPNAINSLREIQNAKERIAKRLQETFKVMNEILPEEKVMQVLDKIAENLGEKKKFK